MKSDGKFFKEKENVIQKKSYDFAVRLTPFCQFLMNEKKEFIISKQLFRSGTSIGANVEEAIGAFTSKDFLNKINIAYKEARETRYWLRLLRDTNIVTPQQIESFLCDVEELMKILIKIQNTKKQNMSS